MPKFELKKVTRNQWIFGIVVLVLYLYLQEGGGELAATVCPDDGIGCKIKEGLRPVWNWMLDNVLLSLGIILLLVFFAYSFDLFKIRRKGGGEE